VGRDSAFDNDREAALSFDVEYACSVSNESKTQRAARDACIGFFNGCSVFLAYGSAGTWATGVVFQSASGAPIVLTARHVAETLPDTFKIGNISGADAHSGVAEQVLLGPPRLVALQGDGREPNIDVAAIVLSGNWWPFLPTGACSEERLCPNEEMLQTDVMILTGYPAFLAIDLRASDRTIALSFVNHATGATGRDEYGRLRVEWDQAVPAAGSHHPKVDVTPGNTFKLGSPGGISGGAFWRIRGTTDKAEVWAPVRSAHLLGVACSWNRRDTEFVEPIGLWAEWFRDVLRRN
jgi:hypothetical protein